MIRKVARDSHGQIMWVQGRTDVSPMSYLEWREARDMTSGSVTVDNDKFYGVFYPPFTMEEEEYPK